MPFQRVKTTKFQNKVPSQLRELHCSPFDLSLPYEPAKGKRCLIITGHVSRHDLEAGRLLSSAEDKHALSVTLTMARKWAKQFAGDDKVDDYVFSTINFNYHKNYHLSSEHHAESIRHSVKRVKAYIEEVQPDIILVMGDSAARHLLKSKTGHINHGLVYKISVGDKEYKAIPTIELSTLTLDPYMENGEKYEIAKTNLFMYAVRTIATMYRGKPCISLKGVTPNAVFVKKMKTFKKMMKEIWAADAVSVDTETIGLHVLDNDILTIQFATSSEKGYVLALKHKDCPFDASELKYIYSELRKFFSRKRLAHKKWKKQPYLIMHNGKFDLRILREDLKVPCIQVPVWDTLAGEFVIDENLIDLRIHTDLKGAWGLEVTAARYNNTWYQTADFGKADRTTIKEVHLNQAELDYCAMDVQLPFAIHLAQMKTAQAIEHEGGNYLAAFKRMMLVQMSNMVHQLSSMKQRGMPLDMNYLMLLRSKASPLRKMIVEAEKKLRDLPNVQKANKMILSERGAPSKGLFGAVTSWVLDIGKSAHKQLLYIDILKLKPVNFGKDGTTPAIDKVFQAAYADVPEVAVLTERSKIKKLDDSYGKGIWNQVKKDSDIKKDGRIRPDYGYLLVTGRTNCTGPNLQQVPEHGKLAPIIKRLFIAPPGSLRVKFDFSVHEVRGWGIVAEDTVLLETFKAINALVLNFRKKKNPTKEDKDEVDTKGDMHKLNYSAFTGVPVEKVTKEERQGAKGITFGSIYGQSVKALAETLKKTVKEAQELTDRFFKKFNKAKKWLDKVGDQAVKRGYVTSPLGRRRNMWAGVMGYERLFNALKRRGQNSPIQGMSSDIAVNAARLMEEAIYDFLLDMDEMPEEASQCPIGVCAMVHDATEAEAMYRHVMALIWIMEYFAIHGVRKFLKEVFDMETHVDFAIEFAVGALGSEMRKWDWTQEGLYEIILKGLQDQKKELGYKVDPDAEILNIYKWGKKYAPELRKRFPLPVEPDFDYPAKRKEAKKATDEMLDKVSKKSKKDKKKKKKVKS